MNISCEVKGRAGCVLLRALEPVAGLKQMARNRGLRVFPPLRQRAPQGWGNLKELTSGPSRLCQALGLKRKPHNGMDLLSAASPLQVRDDGCKVEEILITRRIGIRHAVDLPLRFAVAANACISGPKGLGKSASFPSLAPSLKSSHPHPHRVSKSASNPERKPCT
jgi:DNA-3-methyladenine glycosylase